MKSFYEILPKIKVRQATYLDEAVEEGFRESLSAAALLYGVHASHKTGPILSNAKCFTQLRDEYLPSVVQTRVQT